MNKQKPHLKWSQEARELLAFVTQHTLLTPTVRDIPCCSNRKQSYFNTSAGGKKIPPCSLTAQPMGEHHKSPSEKSLYFEL